MFQGQLGENRQRFPNLELVLVCQQTLGGEVVGFYLYFNNFNRELGGWGSGGVVVGRFYVLGKTVNVCLTWSWFWVTNKLWVGKLLVFTYISTILIESWVVRGLVGVLVMGLGVFTKFVKNHQSFPNLEQVLEYQQTLDGKVVGFYLYFNNFNLKLSGWGSGGAVVECFYVLD
jgi:hypothetical protein